MNDDMAQGYLDGYDLDAPEPSANRSHSYRHGFMVGRAEKLTGNPAAPAYILRKLAADAVSKDWPAGVRDE